MVDKSTHLEALYNSLKYINRHMNVQQLLSPTRMLMNLTRRICKGIKYLNFLHNQAENLSGIFVSIFATRLRAWKALERLRNC